jgi:NADH-quinone oxidoreductase subunit J
MDILFYITSFLLLLSAWKAVSVSNAVHALLYLIFSLLSTALIFFIVGAPYVGVLEIIVYAGAIMVLFIFVVMLLNIGPQDDQLKSQQPQSEKMIPFVLVSIMGIFLFLLLKDSGQSQQIMINNVIGPKEVGLQLFKRYALLVELASFILLAGLIVAYYIGKRLDKKTV